MSEFNKDDYLNDLPDADNLSATGQAGPSDGAAAGSAGKASDSAKSADASADKGAAGPAGDKASAEAGLFREELAAVEELDAECLEEVLAEAISSTVGFWKQALAMMAMS